MAPRRIRSQPAGHWFHVVNRAVNRRQIFFEDKDYQRFLVRLNEAGLHYPVHCGAYCVMPNHFHLVLRPLEDGALSAYVQYLSSRSACDTRSLARSPGAGHVYQGRFWSAPVHDDRYMALLLRYVEGNALRARLVDHASDWPWGSLWERVTKGRRLLGPSPIDLPDEWPAIIDDGCTPSELEVLRAQPVRGRPRKKGSDPFSVDQVGKGV